MNVVLIDELPRNHGKSINVDHIGGVDQGPEEGPDTVETIMKGFQHNGCLGLIEFRQVEKDLGLSRVGHGRLFKENMFAGANGANGPLEVHRVWQWDQDTVNIRVVEDS